MIYILIISLFIKKPFYLLRRQSFSFEIVSEFSNFMSRGWGFWLPVLSRGKGFCTQLLSRGEGFCSLRVVSRGFVPGGDGFGWNWYLHNCHSKLKFTTASSNSARQIQIWWPTTVTAIKICHGKFKFAMANSNSPRKIQIYHGKFARWSRGKTGV